MLSQMRAFGLAVLSVSLTLSSVVSVDALPGCLGEDAGWCTFYDNDVTDNNIADYTCPAADFVTMDANCKHHCGMCVLTTATTTTITTTTTTVPTVEEMCASKRDHWTGCPKHCGEMATEVDCTALGFDVAATPNSPCEWNAHWNHCYGDVDGRLETPCAGLLADACPNYCMECVTTTSTTTTTTTTVSTTTRTTGACNGKTEGQSCIGVDPSRCDDAALEAAVAAGENTFVILLTRDACPQTCSACTTTTVSSTTTTMTTTTTTMTRTTGACNGAVEPYGCRSVDPTFCDDAALQAAIDAGKPTNLILDTRHVCSETCFACTTTTSTVSTTTTTTGTTTTTTSLTSTTTSVSSTTTSVSSTTTSVSSTTTTVSSTTTTVSSTTTSLTSTTTSVSSTTTSVSSTTTSVSSTTTSVSSTTTSVSSTTTSVSSTTTSVSSTTTTVSSTTTTVSTTTTSLTSTTTSVSSTTTSVSSTTTSVSSTTTTITVSSTTTTVSSTTTTTTRPMCNGAYDPDSCGFDARYCSAPTAVFIRNLFKEGCPALCHATENTCAGTTTSTTVSTTTTTTTDMHACSLPADTVCTGFPCTTMIDFDDASADGTYGFREAYALSSCQKYQEKMLFDVDINATVTYADYEIDAFRQDGAPTTASWYSEGTEEHGFDSFSYGGFDNDDYRDYVETEIKSRLGTDWDKSVDDRFATVRAELETNYAASYSTWLADSAAAGHDMANVTFYAYLKMKGKYHSHPESYATQPEYVIDFHGSMIPDALIMHESNTVDAFRNTSGSPARKFALVRISTCYPETTVPPVIQVLKFDAGVGNGDVVTDDSDANFDAIICDERRLFDQAKGFNSEVDDTWAESYCLSGSVAPGSRNHANNPFFHHNDNDDLAGYEPIDHYKSAFPGECSNEYQTVSGWIKVYDETMLKVIVLPDYFGDFNGYDWKVKLSIDTYDPADFSSTTASTTTTVTTTTTTASTTTTTTPEAVCNGVIDQDECLATQNATNLCSRDDVNGDEFRTLCPATCSMDLSILPAGTAKPCADQATCNGEYDDSACANIVSVSPSICSNSLFLAAYSCPIACGTCTSSSTTVSTTTATSATSTTTTSVTSTTTSSIARTTKTRTTTTMTTTTTTVVTTTTTLAKCNSLPDPVECVAALLPLCTSDLAALTGILDTCPVLCGSCYPQVLFKYDTVDWAEKDEFEYKLIELVHSSFEEGKIKAPNGILVFEGDNVPELWEDPSTFSLTSRQRRTCTVSGISVLVTTTDDETRDALIDMVELGSPAGDVLKVSVDPSESGSTHACYNDTVVHYPVLTVRATTSSTTTSTSTSTSTTSTTTLADPCGPGEYRSHSLQYSVGTCSPCPDGTYQTLSTYDTTCHAYAPCAAGEYRPSPDADKTVFDNCVACASGDVKETAGEYNSTCAPYATCVHGSTYSTNDNLLDAETDRVCLAVTQCTSSEYQVLAPTLTQNAICAELTPACGLSTTYEAVAATATGDRACADYAVECVQDASYETMPRTPSSDRTCSSVTVCNSDEFVTSFPTLTDNTECQTFQTCVFSTHETRHPDSSTYDHRWANTADTSDGGVATQDVSCVPREVCNAIFDKAAQLTVSATLCPPKSLTQKGLIFGVDVTSVADSQWVTYMMGTGTNEPFQSGTGAWVGDADFTGDPCNTSPPKGAMTLDVDLHLHHMDAVVHVPKADTSCFLADNTDSSCSDEWHKFFYFLFEPTCDPESGSGSYYSGDETGTSLRERKAPSLEVLDRQRRLFDFSNAGAKSCATLDASVGEVYCSSGGCTASNICCNLGFGSSVAGTCADCSALTCGSAVACNADPNNAGFYSDTVSPRAEVHACIEQEVCGTSLGSYYLDYALRSSSEQLSNRCGNYQRCLVGTPSKLLSSAGTQTADTVCGADVVMCSDSQFWDNYNSVASYANDEWTIMPSCSALDDCAAGTYWSNAANMSTYRNDGEIFLEDRVCTTRTSCESSEYISNAVRVAQEGANSVVNNACQAYSSCESDQYIGLAGTSTADVQCVTLNPCDGVSEDPQTEYIAEDATSTSDWLCDDVSTCSSSSEYEDSAPTPSSDRICTALTECTAGVQYITKNHTADSDRQCGNILQCDSHTCSTELFPILDSADVSCNGACTNELCCVASFAMVRPFYAGDAQDLANSFDAFVAHPPCDLDGTGTPTQQGLPVDLILFYSGDDSVDTDVIDRLENVTGEGSGADLSAPWRSCFSSIVILGAGLTAAQDQYHDDMSDPTWNLGPNMQFYKMVEHMTDTHSSDMFLYMEGDSIPIADNWLDTIASSVRQSRPFSVLGSTYKGHNWDPFEGTSIIGAALANHLNGNAVYDVTHRIVRRALATFEDDMATFGETHRSSFDVEFAEHLIDSENVPVADLALENNDYKMLGEVANFANTLTLPQDIDTNAAVIHGAIYVQNWPSATCPRQLNPSWYPGPAMSATLATSDDSKLTLVVSDFDDGSLATFMDSMDDARAAVAAAMANDSNVVAGDCSGADFLPFAEIVIVALTEDAATQHRIDYPDATVEVRDHSIGSAWWDICTATVTTPWYMVVTSHFVFDEDFALPVDVDPTTADFMPIMPFTLYDSDYCDRTCKAQIEAARTISPSFNHHYGQEYAIFKADIAQSYCQFIQTDLDTYVEPRVDGYFAYIALQDGSQSQSSTQCRGKSDSALCGVKTMVDACTLDDEVGDYVRGEGVCAIACGSCDAVLTGIGSDDYEREELPTFNWWERKVSSGSLGENYKMYNREKLFTVPGFIGLADDSLSCEELGGSYSNCPCKFPFAVDGTFYDNCTAVSDSDSRLWCPTALSNTMEHPGATSSANDWRYCIDADLQLGGRRSRDVRSSAEGTLYAKPRARRGNATHCFENEYVVSHSHTHDTTGAHAHSHTHEHNVCTACPAGTTNVAGDDLAGSETTCDATLCSVDEYVAANVCTACGAGTTNAANDDASGADTTCDATLCGTDERVVNKACVACGAGTTNGALDDASGADTTCDITLCAENEYVSSNVCTSCATGTENDAGNPASGADTECAAAHADLADGAFLLDATQSCSGNCATGWATHAVSDSITVDLLETPHRFKEQACFCDAQCYDHQDCCSNAGPTCGHSAPPPPPPGVTTTHTHTSHTHTTTTGDSTIGPATTSHTHTYERDTLHSGRGSWAHTGDQDPSWIAKNEGGRSRRRANTHPRNTRKVRRENGQKNVPQ